ncbi:hypothetical protein B0H16DRAFT_1890102 [Mycena metata]|uniref:Uncharacterized protein n=1 Tax=Mycena metata TaxID=1033252 RepID=A0AAD7IIN7_9AGAR|nr:hypothetical protein B0H16DRAFT_1890102 [Mycena metata]
MESLIRLREQGKRRTSTPTAHPWIRSILVTGFNQGLGRHTVHQLAQTSDVIVFMGSRKLEAAEEALSKFSSDIHPLFRRALFSWTSPTTRVSNLDVLINKQANRTNAGIVGATFESTYSVNVFGTVAITEVFRPFDRHRWRNPQYLAESRIPSVAHDTSPASVLSGIQLE